MRRPVTAHVAVAICVALVAVSIGVRTSYELGVGAFEIVGGGYVVVQVVLGGLIARRRPDNPIGWLLLAASSCWAVSGASGDVALAGAAAGASGWPSWGAWVGQTIFMPAVVILPWLLPLLFPDGRLPAPSWRWLMLVGSASGVGAIVSAGAAGELTDFRGIPAPFVPGPTAQSVVAAIELVSWLGVTAATVVSIVPVVVRYRGAGPVVRQQMRWLLYSFGLLSTAMVVAGALHGMGLPQVSPAVILLGLAALPTGVAVALLRYRLFDIDRLISRTVGYTIVTAVLAGTYLGIVLALSAATRALGGSSDLAVAVSTLAVAALFQPVRRRVQTAVDRRFDRQRYDAALTIEAFGSELRREVRLDALAGDLRRVVARTLAPRHAGVWIPAAPRSRNGSGTVTAYTDGERGGTT